MRCVLNDPAPEDLACRALEAVRHQVAALSTQGQAPHDVLGGTGNCRLDRPHGFDDDCPADPSRRRPIGHVAGIAGDGADVDAAFDDDLPTAWVYAKAARQSPSVLDELLDRQSHQPTPVNSRPVTRAGVSPFLFLNPFTAP